MESRPISVGVAVVILEQRAVSLESYPVERSEVRDHPSAVDMVYEELGSRNPRWD